MQLEGHKRDILKTVRNLLYKRVTADCAFIHYFISRELVLADARLGTAPSAEELGIIQQVTI